MLDVNRERNALLYLLVRYTGLMVCVDFRKSAVYNLDESIVCT